MVTPKPTFRGRLLVVAGLVVAGASALVLFVRYGLHRLTRRRRNRN